MRFLILGMLGLALTACAEQQPSEGFKPANTEAYGAAEGAKFEMASIIGIGDIVIGEAALTTSDGQQLPIRKVAAGIYQFLDPPSELTNGENFCFSKPVTYFTWHKHEEGLWVMNVGDWPGPPAVPASNEWDTGGGCGLSTYTPAAA